MEADCGPAAACAGILVGVPLVVGFTISRILAEPFYEVAQRYNPDVFALSDQEKVEGAKEVHKHELRLVMDAAIGRAPPISDLEMQVRALVPFVPERYWSTAAVRYAHAVSVWFSGTHAG